MDISSTQLMLKGRHKIVVFQLKPILFINLMLMTRHIQCDWANPGTGIKIEDGFTLVNLHQGLKTFESDPFILASQAKQVFYSRDNDESNWYVLLKAPPRGIHNMNVLEEDAYTSSTPLDVSQLEINITEKEPYSRNECEGIDENITNNLSRMDSNNSTNSLEDLHGKEPIADEKIDKKKGRGASKLKMVSGQDKCKELERNEFGQPIGDNSVKYASFLGCMIKEFVPYTLDGWSDIDEEVKDRMWSCLQMTYKVEDWEKKSIFQKLAKLWRDRKSKLQILVREANTSRVASRDLSLLKPEFMDQNQWDLFVQRTLSSTFQVSINSLRP
ncbi:hypothetical protein ZIOFF_050812 [Zingiber officinale]|uniref:DUF4216 domain-containing protein n=1 Tax=Zingiber officinale TaxID=94328 RepID=A0A8J5FKT4_ZINOF|nr:hypothetical protein ZIOFF_050812 [Zingiber officinale]